MEALDLLRETDDGWRLVLTFADEDGDEVLPWWAADRDGETDRRLADLVERLVDAIATDAEAYVAATLPLGHTGDGPPDVGPAVER